MFFFTIGIDTPQEYQMKLNDFAEKKTYLVPRINAKIASDDFFSLYFSPNMLIKGTEKKIKRSLK